MRREHDGEGSRTLSEENFNFASLLSERIKAVRGQKGRQKDAGWEKLWSAAGVL